jgi:hypothetical protein
MTVVGLPHSGTPGSTPARGSPGRIVVRHALRRLSAPRHPPVALCSLIVPMVLLDGAPTDPAIAPAPPEGGTRQTPGPTGAQSALVYTCKASLLPVCSFQGARRPRTRRSSGRAPLLIDGAAGISRMRIPEN